MQEFVGGYLEALGQSQDIIGCQNDLDITATGSKTFDPGMTAELDLAVCCQFDWFGVSSY